MSWKLWVLFGVVVFMAIILIDAYFFSPRRKKRPLSEQFGADRMDPKDAKPPLGMEEIDMDIVRDAEQGNRTHLERNDRNRPWK